MDRMTKKEEYLPPQLSLYTYAVEAGYALSTQTERYNSRSLNGLLSSGTEPYLEASGDLYGIQATTTDYDRESNEGDFWNMGTF